MVSIPKKHQIKPLREAEEGKGIDERETMLRSKLKSPGYQ